MATILLAEDESDIRKLLKQVLERRGYLVLEAADAAEAMAIYEEHRRGIHLLLSDVRMPGMTGVELATELRRNTEDLPVLLMSGYTTEVPDQFDFLPKPFLAPELLRGVERVLNRTVVAACDIRS